MLKKSAAALLLLIPFGVTALFGPGASAASEVAQDGTLLFRNGVPAAGITFSGMSSFRQLNFTIPKYWNVRQVELHLDYSVTPLALEWITSVTLLINDVPFDSFRPKQDGRMQQLKVDVPLHLLKEGNNRIELQSFVRTDDRQVCSVGQTPEQWLQLHATSGINVSYAMKPLSGAINDFHQRFAGLDTIRSGHGLIAVPAGNDPSELEAAVYALSGFAKGNPWEDKEIPLLPYKAEHLQDKQLVVLIGLYDRLPEEAKQALAAADPNSEIDLGTVALLRLASIGDRPTLVITSRSPELLAKAGRFAANSELMGQLDRGMKTIDADTAWETPPPLLETYVQLTAAGDELRGPYYRENTYFVSMPANRTIANAGMIRLDFRYAENLDFNRSLVTAFVNGKPVGSKRLTQGMAGGDMADFVIPSDLQISGNFSVTIGFDLQLLDASCAPNQEKTPWAFITSESAIDFRTKDRTELLFPNYPYPFLRDGAYDRVAVVLPANPDGDTERAFSNVFNLLGKYAASNAGEVSIYPDTVDAGVLKERNVIALGTYENNGIIRDVNGSLYFRYDASGRTIVSNEKMSIESDYGSRVGTLQLLDSPYAPGRGLLAVTGARSEAVYLASKLLANERGRWSVYGDGVVTDKDGNTKAFRFKKMAVDRSGSFLTDAIKRKDVLGFVTAASLTVGLSLVSLLLLIRKYRRKQDVKTTEPGLGPRSRSRRR